jgi:hypothetical protein
MKIRERKTLNRALLRKLARKLRRLRHEEHYRQGSYGQETECGTAACIAGHTVLMSGHNLGECYGQCVKGGRVYDIHRTAQRLLGLTDGEASRIFGAVALYWPSPYDWRYQAAAWGNSKERPSRVAAEMLMAIAAGKVKP